MNYRYLLGALAAGAMHRILACRWLPLFRALPFGSSWLYDLQRFAQRRDFTVFVDAGANVGQTSREIFRYFPRASIHAFEPIQATFQHLAHAFAGRPTVHCVPCALGAQSGRLTVRLRENSELNTLVSATGAPGGEATRCEEVEIKTLDHYCRQHAITHIDVLKLDVQGYELEVLRGAIELLQERRIHAIYSEVAFACGNREMQDFTELHPFLLSHGFGLAGFYEPFRWGPGKRHLDFCNALYLRVGPYSPATAAAPPVGR